MKTAVCLTGIARSILVDDNVVFHNLAKNLIDCWEDRDVYYVIGRTDGEYTDTAIKLYTQLDNVSIIEVPQFDLDLEGVVFNEDDWQKETKPSAQSLGKFLNKRLILGSFLRTMGKKYDRVLISRDDVIYPNPITNDVEDLDLSKLWIPNWSHWRGGYNDRFAVSNQEFMNTYFEAWKHRHEVKKIHIESYYRYCIEKYIGNENLGLFYTEFQRIRASGYRVPEEWRTQAVYQNLQGWREFL